MTWLKKEIEESSNARQKQNLHIKEVNKTRNEHNCKFCHHVIPIGQSAKVVTEVIDNQYTNSSFYKTYYYHGVCFLQKYPNLRPTETGQDSSPHTTNPDS